MQCNLTRINEEGNEELTEAEAGTEHKSEAVNLTPSLDYSG